MSESVNERKRERGEGREKKKITYSSLFAFLLVRMRENKDVEKEL